MTSPGHPAAHHTHPMLAAGGHPAPPVLASALAQAEIPATPSPDDGLVPSLRQGNQALVSTAEESVDLLRVLGSAWVVQSQGAVVDVLAVNLLTCVGRSALVTAHRPAERRTCVTVATPRRTTRRPLASTGLNRYRLFIAPAPEL